MLDAAKTKLYKRFVKSFKAWARQTKVRKKARVAARRLRHDYLYKLNCKTYGKKKAGVIAVCYRKKRLGTFIQTRASIERSIKHKSNKFWFLGGDECRGSLRDDTNENSN